MADEARRDRAFLYLHIDSLSVIVYKNFLMHITGSYYSVLVNPFKNISVRKTTASPSKLFFQHQQSYPAHQTKKNMLIEKDATYDNKKVSLGSKFIQSF